MKAISIRQPWAHMIVHCPWSKDIENRTRRVNHEGPLAIHASLTETLKDWETARQFCEARGLPEPPPRGSTPKGGIVGKVNSRGCVESSDSPWWDDSPYGLVLEGQEEVPFQPCKGALYLFDVELKDQGDDPNA